jgi:hypothetical protein
MPAWVECGETGSVLPGKCPSIASRTLLKISMVASLEHQEVQSCRWLLAVVVCRRIECVLELIVERVEVASHWNGGAWGVGLAVVALGP